jgi:pectin methylesterase-like acyl-CoA thioesterase
MLPFKLVFILTLALAASVPASALTFDSIQHGVDLYNSGVENAPGVVKTLLGDEKIQVEITRADGTALMAGLETKNAVIVNAIEGEIEDPTIVIDASEEAITWVYQADDPVAAFEEAKKEGEISIRGTTFTSKLKVSAALASTPALRFFASLIRK